MSEDGKIRVPAHGWVPRSYQLPVWNYILQDKPNLRAVTVWHRRSGKDLTSINLMMTKCLQRKGLYIYVGPFQNQIRRILWEGREGSGHRFIDYIPKELIVRKLEQSMMIELKTGQTIQLLGADNPDCLVGPNPVGAVFSEYSLCDPEAWEYMQPIFRENKGWVLFNGTPRGKNHLYEVLNKYKADPDCFASHLTAEDTGVFTRESLEQARVELNNESKFQSEYMASFDAPIEGSFYGPLIQAAYDGGRVVSHGVADPELPVHTAWDLGMRDPTAIWFFQTHRNEVRLLDYYEETDTGLPELARMLESWASKYGVRYGKHLVPHDAKVTEFSTGVTRLEMAARLGLRLEPQPKLSIADGIEAVCSLLPRCYFVQPTCGPGLDRLRGYHRAFDEKNRVYRKHPADTEHTHGADAFRYLALGLKSAQSMGKYEDLPGMYSLTTMQERDERPRGCPPSYEV